MVFSLVNAILLRSLPYPEPDRLVQLWFTPPERPDQSDVAQRRRSAWTSRRKESFFTAAGCYIGVAGNVADPADAQTTGPEWLEGEMLTYHAVQALGVKPLMGRWFTEAEDHGDAEKVMLISYDLWQRRFNGAPDVLGKRLRVDRLRRQRLSAARSSASCRRASRSPTRRPTTSFRCARRGAAAAARRATAGSSRG